jgi:hypothetical protein
MKLKPAQAERPLWRCPKCARRFANCRQAHSCGRWTVASHLARCSPAVRRLFRAFTRMVRRAGPFTYAPVASRIGLQARMIFAAAYPKRDRLDIHLILPQHVRHPRFTRIGPGGDHHLRITSSRQLDAQLARWVRAAYSIGRQEKL